MLSFFRKKKTPVIPFYEDPRAQQSTFCSQQWQFVSGNAIWPDFFSTSTVTVNPMHQEVEEHRIDINCKPSTPEIYPDAFEKVKTE